MTKLELLQTARRLVQPPAEVAREYASKRESLAAEMNRLMLARPDVERLAGPGNLAMMEDNHRNHARFLESVFLSFSPEVLVETVLWVYRAYRAHGFGLAYWPAQLSTWIDILGRRMTPDACVAIEPFYHWMIIHQADFVTLSEASRGPDAPTIPEGEPPRHGAQRS
jgi:hypothetical protein